PRTFGRSTLRHLHWCSIDLLNPVPAVTERLGGRLLRLWCNEGASCQSEKGRSAAGTGARVCNAGDKCLRLQRTPRRRPRAPTSSTKECQGFTSTLKQVTPDATSFRGSYSFYGRIQRRRTFLRMEPGPEASLPRLARQGPFSTSTRSALQ